MLIPSKIIVKKLNVAKVEVASRPGCVLYSIVVRMDWVGELRTRPDKIFEGALGNKSIAQNTVPDILLALHTADK